LIRRVMASVRTNSYSSSSVQCIHYDLEIRRCDTFRDRQSLAISRMVRMALEGIAWMPNNFNASDWIRSASSSKKSLWHSQSQWHSGEQYLAFIYY